MAGSLRAFFSIGCIGWLVACGSAGAGATSGQARSVPSTTSAADAGDTHGEPAAAVTASHLPMACVDPSASICAPPGDFVDRLCAKPFQDVALALFAKETPFTRLYLRGKLDELDLDEEVLVLRFHVPQKGGMVVGSGNGTYDVLRWDGTCARAVEAEMLARARPARPRSAHVQWHRIGSAYQDALIAGSDAVKRAHAKRGKECQGAMTGDVSKACEKADQALVDAVVDSVRTRGSLSEPPALP